LEIILTTHFKPLTLRERELAALVEQGGSPPGGPERKEAAPARATSPNTSLGYQNQQAKTTQKHEGTQEAGGVKMPTAAELALALAAKDADAKRRVLADFDAAAKAGKDKTPKAPVVFKTLAAFFAEFEAVSFAIEPIVRSSSLYTLTGSTGVGKTSILLARLFAVLTGRAEILGLKEGSVKKGERIVYYTAENPDDLRMRLIVNAEFFGVDIAEVLDRVLILDRRESPEDIIAALATVGEISLGIVDTFQAAYDGDNCNDPVQMGEFVRRFRPWTQLPGRPPVIIASHRVTARNPPDLLKRLPGTLVDRTPGKPGVSRVPPPPVQSAYFAPPGTPRTGRYTTPVHFTRKRLIFLLYRAVHDPGTPPTKCTAVPGYPLSLRRGLPRTRYGRHGGRYSRYREGTQRG
jgi:AAA domain